MFTLIKVWMCPRQEIHKFQKIKYSYKKLVKGGTNLLTIITCNHTSCAFGESVLCFIQTMVNVYSFQVFKNKN